MQDNRPLELQAIDGDRLDVWLMRGVGRDDGQRLRCGGEPDCDLVEEGPKVVVLMICLSEVRQSTHVPTTYSPETGLTG